MQETSVWFLGQEDPLMKGMATFQPGEFYGDNSIHGVIKS